MTNNIPVLTEEQIKIIKDFKEPFPKNCPFQFTENNNIENCNCCPLCGFEDSCNVELFYKAKFGLLDKADCQAPPAPKFTSISKREYFDLQVKMANSLTRDTFLGCNGTADSSVKIIDRILLNNNLKVEE